MSNLIVCEKEFPKGYYKGQKRDGFPINIYLKENIDVFCRNITRDLDFFGIISGRGMLGNGKSTLAQQVGAYYSSEMSRLTKTHVPFTINNIVFTMDDLMERAFELPRYSCIILDEGDDVTSHYFTKEAQRLKTFFRKNRQLNLFIIMILPDFFDIPKSYAIVRSNFLINVKFVGEFERGYFDFYGPNPKKYLYLKGKKELNYKPKGVNPSFDGVFSGFYPVDPEAYREMKYKDMKESDILNNRNSAKVLFKQKISVWYGRLYENLNLTHKQLGKIIGVTERACNNYWRIYNEGDVRHLKERTDFNN